MKFNEKFTIDANYANTRIDKWLKLNTQKFPQSFVEKLLRSGKIKVNNKIKSVSENYRMADLVKILKIPLKKVAIELNQEIIDKKNINKINLKKNDKIEIVHFIGGG